MQIQVGNKSIELVQGDITEMATDAIVNAANKDLVLGAGVAGAIKKKGGPTIQEECNEIGGTYVGGAVMTSGGNLNAKYVIHAVGPRMGEGDEDEKLRSATVESLKRADEKSLKSIAFPAISTGIFGFPKDRCARIMLAAAKEFLGRDTSLERVVFCLYGEETHRVFVKEIEGLA